MEFFCEDDIDERADVEMKAGRREYCNCRRWKKWDDNAGFEETDGRGCGGRTRSSEQMMILDGRACYSR